MIIITVQQPELTVSQDRIWKVTKQEEEELPVELQVVIWQVDVMADMDRLPEAKAQQVLLMAQQVQLTELRELLMAQRVLQVVQQELLTAQQVQLTEQRVLQVVLLTEWLQVELLTEQVAEELQVEQLPALPVQQMVMEQPEVMEQQEVMALQADTALPVVEQLQVVAVRLQETEPFSHNKEGAFFKPLSFLL
jgi:hypothetical protein